jgi:glutamine amidotransferase
VTRLAVLDLGYGNTGSIALAFERLGIVAELTADPAIAAAAQQLVLPGVGAAGPAMARLRALGLDEVLAQRTRPTLGICLGMQLLECSAEDPSTPLLGLVAGEVTRLAPAKGFPVPHMGWSRVTGIDEDIGLADGDHVYFAHSFRCPDGTSIAARAAYGSVTIPAVLRRDNLWGAQFHPERSSAAGARFLEAFATS